MSVKPKALETEPKLCKPSSFDTFETDKLTRELGDAVEYDRLYKKTDDLKKRVIVEAADYDEFRNRVLCADLKPLSSHDIKNMAQGKPAHNRATGTGGGAAAVDKAGARKKRGLRKSKKASAVTTTASTFTFMPPTCCPANSADFVRDWRRNCPSIADKLAFVALVTQARSSVEGALPSGIVTTGTTADGEGGGAAWEAGSAWGALFPTEMEASLLAEIVVTVLASAMSQSPAAAAEAMDSKEVTDESLFSARLVLATLRGLTAVGRFTLNVSFFSKDERAKCGAIFDWLVMRGLPASDVDAVRTRYQL